MPSLNWLTSVGPRTWPALLQQYREIYNVLFSPKEGGLKLDLMLMSVVLSHLYRFVVIAFPSPALFVIYLYFSLTPITSTMCPVKPSQAVTLKQQQEIHGLCRSSLHFFQMLRTQCQLLLLCCLPDTSLLREMPPSCSILHECVCSTGSLRLKPMLDSLTN